jgi:hypothetical protein
MLTGNGNGFKSNNQPKDEPAWMATATAKQGAACNATVTNSNGNGNSSLLWSENA